MLSWANRFSIFCLLDNNNYNFSTPAFECILAAGSRRSLYISGPDAFEKLKLFFDESPSWLFGHIGYEITSDRNENEDEKVSTGEFAPGFFFEPEIILQLNEGRLAITSAGSGAEEIFNSINKEIELPQLASKLQLQVGAGVNREEYVDIINALKDHIRRGDCYEINFCQRFFVDGVSIDPIQTYQELVAASPMPFAALYKLHENFCICASPERYLKKSGTMVTSQPMKGTSKRIPNNAEADAANKNYLLRSSKEKSENVMVVDLVRNDLSKICKEGSVVVDELFGVYSFPTVHQMTSTISGIMRDDLHWTAALSATFPMGSMTGAPKKRVMELIARYEKMDRGLFSGSIGYVTPDRDFDFNVVIRSIFYNDFEKKLSFYAGSGITFYSDAEDEYEECKLKTNAILSVLAS
jgi:para-aminobenzoate synthetase component 1